MIDPTKIRELADAAFLQASANVIRVARRTKTPLILWRDGKVAAVPPDERWDWLLPPDERLRTDPSNPSPSTEGLEPD
jgi:hypothetical protein